MKRFSRCQCRRRSKSWMKNYCLTKIKTSTTTALKLEKLWESYIGERNRSLLICLAKKFLVKLLSLNCRRQGYSQTSLMRHWSSSRKKLRAILTAVRVASFKSITRNMRKAKMSLSRRNSSNLSNKSYKSKKSVRRINNRISKVLVLTMYNRIMKRLKKTTSSRDRRLKYKFRQTDTLLLR